MERAWSAVRTHGKLAVSTVVALLVLAVGGLSVALAAGGGNDERSDREQFAPGSFNEGAPAPDPELEAKMDEFRDCMAAEGFEPPEPSERPDISEGPPEGLSDAFEKCGELLPEGMPHGPPGIGPPPIGVMGPPPGGVMECKARPEHKGSERDSGHSDSAEESGGE